MKAYAESKTIIPVVATGARTTGQLIGDKIAVDVAHGNNTENSVFLQQLVLIDSDKLGKIIKAVIFKDDYVHPGHGNVFAPSISEVASIVDEITFTTYRTYSLAYASTAKQLALLVPGNANRKFYIALVAGENLTVVGANPFTIVPQYYID